MYCTIFQQTAMTPNFFWFPLKIDSTLDCAGHLFVTVAALDRRTASRTVNAGLESR